DFHVTGVQTCALPISAKMIELAGGDLKSKRQARSKFLREHEVRAEALADHHIPACVELLHRWRARADEHAQGGAPHVQVTVELRSEERRVGKEWRSRR